MSWCAPPSGGLCPLTPALCWAGEHREHRGLSSAAGLARTARPRWSMPSAAVLILQFRRKSQMDCLPSSLRSLARSASIVLS